MELYKQEIYPASLAGDYPETMVLHEATQTDINNWLAERGMVAVPESNLQCLQMLLDSIHDQTRDAKDDLNMIQAAQEETK